MRKKDNEFSVIFEEPKERAELIEMKIEYGELLEDAFAPVFGVVCAGCKNTQWGVWCG